jgi:hypothetical protein
MRTTLDIADDVLSTAKEELVRQALATPQPSTVREPKAVHGFKPFAARRNVVTNDMIDQLRNDDAY